MKTTTALTVLLALLSCDRPDQWAQAAEPPSQHAMTCTTVGMGWYRCYNPEVICYYNDHGMSCHWK